MSANNTLHNSENIQLDIAPLKLSDDSKLSLYSDCVVIHALDDYIVVDGEVTKQLGKRIGIYHPLISRVLVPDEFEWNVIDQLSRSSSISMRQLEQHYNGQFSRVADILAEFRHFGLVLEETEQLNFDIQPEYNAAELYINITERCNFSCPGCATASDLIAPSQARSLNRSTTKLFLERFFHACAEKGITQSRVKWAGGEPMLKDSYQIIVATQETIQQLRRLYPDISLKQVILTNGVFLNNEKIDFALKHNMHVSVSLWGTALFQDTARRPRNKRETFPYIIENLRKLHESGGSYNVNYVLTPENAIDFPEFISIMWDVEHPNFVGKNWRNKEPVPLGINFFRPQTQAQIEDVFESYRLMENSLRFGFARILDMIKRGINVQSLHNIDYLSLFSLTTTPCGSGFNYIAVGPEGAAPCHEGLFRMKPNLDRITQGENMFDIVNEYYQHDRELLHGTNIEFKEGKRLKLHGGQGCPRLARMENNGNLGTAASTSTLYNAIYEELLSLETMRQITRL
jgi:sulfatase maturation enzyme AslB (radical SAM superfamily)